MLQQLYEATDGLHWSNNDGWKVYGPVGDPCNSNSHFDGVGCKNPCDDAIEGRNCRMGRLTRLALPNRSLSGTIPPSLSILRMLSILDLSENNLSGTLPTQLGLLGKLSRLELRGNRISGTIPSELGAVGNASKLMTKFDLFTLGVGKIYEESKHAEHLLKLTMGNNEISGAIPSELGRLTDLTYLDLQGNKALGTPLPAWRRSNISSTSHANTTTGNASLGDGILGNASSHIEDSWERVEGFSGVPGLPSQIGRLRDLRVLHVSHMALQNALPTQLGQLSRLQSVSAANSNLNGWLPTQLGNLPQLQHVRLANNQISGSLPIELGNATSLMTIDLEKNLLSGSIPDLFGLFQRLEYWSTYDCNFNKSHLPPSVKNVAARTLTFKFFVQDEQLEYLADHRCKRDQYIWQAQTGRKNLGLRLIRNYDYYRDTFCHEREQPGGLEAAFRASFGDGERDANGMLKPGHHIYHAPDSPVLRRSAVASGLRFRREDAWKLHGTFRDGNGEMFEGTNEPSFYSMAGIPKELLPHTDFLAPFPTTPPSAPPPSVPPPDPAAAARAAELAASAAERAAREATEMQSR